MTIRVTYTTTVDGPALAAARLLLSRMGIDPADLITNPGATAAGSNVRRLRTGGLRCGHRRHAPHLRLLLGSAGGRLGSAAA